MKKIITIAILALMLMGLFTYANAANLTWIFETDGHGYWATTTSNTGGLIYCMEMGKSVWDPSLLPGLYEGMKTEPYCGKCDPGKPAVSTMGRDVAYTVEYEDQTTIDYTKHQDLAYALAMANEYYSSSDAQEIIQKILWQTDMNISGIYSSDEIDRHTATTTPYVTYTDTQYLYEEAVAYRKFYEEVQAKGGFITKDVTDKDAVTTSVDQKDDTYVIGPYKIDYSKGIFKAPNGRVVYFGWIDKMELVDQDGNTLQIVELLDINGDSISDRPDYAYPDSEEEFYVKFQYDGSGKANKVKLEVDFRYIDECYAEMAKLTGTWYQWKWEKEPLSGPHHHDCKKYCNWIDDCDCDDYHDGSDICLCRNCDCGYWKHNYFDSYRYVLEKSSFKIPQTLLEVAAWADKKEGTDHLTVGEWTDITMSLGGTVFFDNHAGKAGNVNGKYYPSQDGDYGLKDIEVTLYEEDGTLAVLAPFDANVHEAEDRPRTNPTLTNSDGYYEFNGMDAQKKYYVVFRFNGQEYENTACNIDKNAYNTDEWKVTSKASITTTDRDVYNGRFEHIYSSPNNYNGVQTGITGFSMNANRTFTPAQTKDAREELYNRIRAEMEGQEKYPDAQALRSIYSTMANRYGQDLIQYIVDTEIKARTGDDSTKQVFPMTDKFNININDKWLGDNQYEAIYDGQYYINLGVMEREKADMNLRKDLYEARVEINNKVYTYRYNKRDDENLEIELRGTDINPYDSTQNWYERDIRESDIQYIDYINKGPERLRVFLTYRIRVYNSSNGDITTYVDSIYDYYDSDYTYVDSFTNPNNKDGKINWTQQGDAGNSLKKMVTDGYSVGLRTGAYTDVYVEYEVNTDALQRLLTAKEMIKENYAEIGSYSTYYTYARTYANGKQINGAGYKAGLVDIDSRPGNFDPTSSEVQSFVEYSYTDSFRNQSGAAKTEQSIKVFEDDADKAPGIKLILYEDTRDLNGSVWEDANLEDKLKNENIRVGDGINNENQMINNMKVELVDLDRGNVCDIYNPTTKRFETAVTYTNASGYYEFNGYIPGNYTVRYTYGEGETLTTTANAGKVYNGQDYKSTLYDEGAHVAWNGNNPNYWYTAANDDKSDAQDDLGLRNELNQKTASMTNHVANVLNYKTESGQDAKGWLGEFQEKSEMKAYTNTLVLEVEYAKQYSEYTTDVKDYELKNIDFGITERPRAELTLTKDIENIRVITTSGATIFDANEETANLAWIKPVVNPAGNDVIGRVQATIEENVTYGSTIKILYRFTVENTGERDYINSDGSMNKKFYNTGMPDGEVVRTNIDTILDYVENNLNFGKSLEEEKTYNNNWQVITKDELQKGNNDSLVDDTIDISSYRTFIVNTNNAPLTAKLAPANKRGEKGETATDTLLLTKVMQSMDDTNGDDLTYDNGTEIVKTSNGAGRRSYNVKDKSNYRKDEVADCVVSIPGNFNPITLAALEEPDADVAETVIVLPPFGEDKSIFYIVGGVAIIAILGIGIYIIKKKVLDAK